MCSFLCCKLYFSEFLSEFSEFLSQLVPSPDKVIVVGDFNIHVDAENINFDSILDSTGFSQSVHRPTHCLNHTLRTHKKRKRIIPGFSSAL